MLVIVDLLNGFIVQQWSEDAGYLLETIQLVSGTLESMCVARSGKTSLNIETNNYVI